MENEFKTICDETPVLDILLAERYERRHGLPMESAENAEAVVVEIEDRVSQVTAVLEAVQGKPKFYFVQDLLRHGLEAFLEPSLEAAKEKLAKFNG
jgi:hypothetical protein